MFNNPKEVAKFAETTYESAVCMIMRGSVNHKRKCRFIKVDLYDLICEELEFIPQPEFGHRPYSQHNKALLSVYNKINELKGGR